jgi:hypothetical protein
MMLSFKRLICIKIKNAIFGISTLNGRCGIEVFVKGFLSKE